MLGDRNFSCSFPLVSGPCFLELTRRNRECESEFGFEHQPCPLPVEWQAPLCVSFQLLWMGTGTPAYPQLYYEDHMPPLLWVTNRGPCSGGVSSASMRQQVLKHHRAHLTMKTASRSRGAPEWTQISEHPISLPLNSPYGGTKVGWVRQHCFLKTLLSVLLRNQYHIVFEKILVLEDL